MTKPNEKIALYGGSFDPIHLGHVILARDAKEQLDLDAVVFLPARISPHKLDRPPSPPEVRSQMVAAAIADEPGLLVDDREIHREGPSFAIDTVQQYRKKHPRAELFYLIGDDNLAELHTWKDIATLQEVAQIVVLTRDSAAPTGGFPSIRRQIEISSTEIRNRIARGLSIRYMVPEPVCNLITNLGLYRND